MRLLLSLLAILVAQPVLAQAAVDLQLSISTDTTTIQTGQRFSATVRVKNVSSGDTVASVFFAQNPSFILDAQAPSAWGCGYSTCNGPIGPGAEEQIRFTMLGPNRHWTSGGTFPIIAVVHPSGNDMNGDNNSAQVVMHLSQTDMVADLGVRYTEGLLRMREGVPAELELAVTNEGPTEARNVIVVVQPSRTISTPPWTVEGAGWACSSTGSEYSECVRPRLAPSESATLTMRLTTPARDVWLSFRAFAVAEGNLDQQSENDLGHTDIFVGSAENFRRILLPLAASDLRGANGSLWRTKTTMLIVDDPLREVRIQPHPCEYILFHCYASLPPVGVAFDPSEMEFLMDPLGQSNGGSQFFYVRASNEAKLRLSSRVYDSSRESDTAGASIPIAREADFASHSISILGIPVRSQYRYTLRVYDFDAIEGAQVAIRVFADGETEPRTTIEGTLRLGFPQSTTTARLPARPAYLQVDATAFAAMAGVDSMRIDIEPLTPGAKIWAFVSVTDNDTHHVTTFSPQ